MTNPVVLKSKSQLCLAVCEEFGYRLHLWFPPFPVSELESKWLSIGAAGMKGLFDSLGGEWVEVFEDPEASESDQEAYALYLALNTPGHYSAHICCDMDSHLVTPDGRVVVHGGFDWASSSDSDNDPRFIARALSLQVTPK